MENELNWLELQAKPGVEKVLNASAEELNELLAEQNAKTYNVFNGPVYNMTAEQAQQAARETQDANRVEHASLVDSAPSAEWKHALSDPDGYLAEKAAEKEAKEMGAYTDAGAFIFDQPEGIPAIWGDDLEVLWAEGEALMIAGSAGLGKTTITGQVMRGLLGLQDSVLGLPVRQIKGTILYLAMDRPRQIARSLRRHFDRSERHVLSERVVVWQGPPLEDMAANDQLLAAMCRKVGASVVIVDSVKDAAVGLSDDKVGAGWNRSIQAVLRDGTEVLEMHHMVKKGTEGKAPTQLSEVYGSTWLTAGVGSVILLHGKAGNPRVQLVHLKQPGDVVGPWIVEHNHSAGTSAVVNDKDASEKVKIAQFLQGQDAPVVPYGIEKATGISNRRVKSLLETMEADEQVEKQGKGYVLRTFSLD